MEHLLTDVVARVPVLLRCLDARGEPVARSGHSMIRASTNAQELLQRVYDTVRPEGRAGTVTASFQETSRGRLHVEYLVVDTPVAARRRLPRRGRRTGAQAALDHATEVVFTAWELVGLLTAAGSGQWMACDDPGHVEVVPEDGPARRVPVLVRTVLGSAALLDLVRGSLSSFVDDDVERLVLGRNPETPGRCHETVIDRSPQLVRFLQGQPLSAPADVVGGPERS